jgi:amino acid transporter
MAIVSFLLAAFVAGVTALSYAEFVGLYPESGGGYAYVSNVFDTDLTYVVGWAMIIGYPASAAFYLASFSEWAHRFLLPALSVEAAVPYWTLGTGVLGFLLLLNLVGSSESGAFQILTTALKIGLIGAFLWGTLSAFDPAIVAESVRQNSQTLADFRSIALTSGLVFVTFFGFEAIATNAEEIERPERTVPRAILISLASVLVIYVLVAIAMVLAIENTGFLRFIAEDVGLSGTDAARGFVTSSGEVAMAHAAEYYMGNWGYMAIVVGALVSMVSAANATVMAGSRVKLAMARRGHLPDGFDRLHPCASTPYAAVILTSVFIFVLIYVFTVMFGGPVGVGGHSGLLGLEMLAHFADFMLLSGLATVNIALVGSRWKHPNADRPFRVPLVPLVPALGVIASLLLLLGLELDATLLGASTLTAATVVGWALLDPDSASTPISDYSEPPCEDATVLAPVRDEADRSLVTVGGALAAGTGGSVMPLGVVELPGQTPPSAGEERLEEKRDLLETASGGVDDEYVEGRVRAAHDFGNAVRNAVEDHEPDVLLLSARDAVDVCLFGGGRTLLSSLEETFDCDVCVFRSGSIQSIDSVFVGAADGPHAETSITAAAAVARATDARLDLYRAVSSSVDDETLHTAHDDLTERAESLADVNTRTLIEPTDEPRQAFLDRSESSDLVVIGSTDGRDEDVNVAGAVLRGRDAPTLVVQSGAGSVHLPLF